MDRINVNSLAINEFLISNNYSHKTWKKFLNELIINDSTIILETNAQIYYALKNNQNIDLILDICDFILDYGSNDFKTLFQICLEEIYHLNSNKGHIISQITTKKLLFLIQKWANKLGNIYPKFKEIYEKIKKEKLKFPPLDIKIETYLKYIPEEEILSEKEILEHGNRIVKQNMTKTIFINNYKEDPLDNKSQSKENKENGKLEEVIADNNKGQIQEDSSINNNYIINASEKKELDSENQINIEENKIPSEKENINNIINADIDITQTPIDLNLGTNRDPNLGCPPNKIIKNLDNNGSILSNIGNSSNNLYKNLYFSGKNFEINNNKNINSINDKDKKNNSEKENTNEGNKDNNISRKAGVNDSQKNDIKKTFSLDEIYKYNENFPVSEESLNINDNDNDNNCIISNSYNDYNLEHNFIDEDKTNKKIDKAFVYKKKNFNNKKLNNQPNFRPNNNIVDNYKYPKEEINEPGLNSLGSKNINNSKNIFNNDNYNKINNNNININSNNNNININNNKNINDNRQIKQKKWSSSCIKTPSNYNIRNSYLHLFDINFLKKKIEKEVKKLNSWIDEGFISFHNTYTGNLKKGIDNIKKEISVLNKLIDYYKNSQKNIEKENMLENMKKMIENLVSRYEKFENENSEKKMMFRSCMSYNGNNLVYPRNGNFII